MKPTRFGLSLQGKISLLLVLFILIPIALFGYVLNERSIRFVSERTDKETSQVLNLVRQNVDQLLMEYETQLQSIYDSEEAIAALGKLTRADAAAAGRQSSPEAINRFLRNFLMGKDDLDSIYLYGADNHMFFADFKGSSFFNDQFASHPEWQHAVDAAGGRAVWLPTYELPANRYFPQRSQNFLIGMQIKNVADVMQTLGTVYMNVKISTLDRLIGNVRVSPNGALLIADEAGNLIWNRNSEAYGVKLGEFAFYQELMENPQSHAATYKLNGEVYRVGLERSDYNGWYFLSLIPQADLNEQSNELRQFLLVTLIVFGVSFVLLALLVSRNITRPIRQMALAMKKIHKDNLGVRLPASSGDEIGLLQSAFNSMRGRINDLIQEVRIVSDKEKEAEVRALQAQINPHFVYNSLDTINWMAIDRDQTEISAMITALSDIMRYAIRPGEQTVTLEEELMWARNYAYLQKMRFEERFEIEFHVEPPLLHRRVPRLFIQPYLENSILHGMEHVEEGGLVTVTVDPDEATGGMRVRLSDNGAGISENELKNIISRKSHGIGIYNLDDRLKLEYGSEYGVEIESAPGAGTTVTIVLPLIE